MTTGTVGRIPLDSNRREILAGVDSLGNIIPVQVDPATQRLLVSAVGGAGLITTTYDYISVASGSTVDVYTYKLGGAGGIIVATVTITYTDNTKTTLVSLAKT